jgi:hypothetical protein
VSGQWDQMNALVPDEVLNAFAVVARWEDLADKLLGQYGGLVDRLLYALPFDTAPAEMLTEMVEKLHRGHVDAAANGPES